MGRIFTDKKEQKIGVNPSYQCYPCALESVTLQTPGIQNTPVDEN